MGSSSSGMEAGGSGTGSSSLMTRGFFGAGGFPAGVGVGAVAAASCFVSSSFLAIIASIIFFTSANSLAEAKKKLRKLLHKDVITYDQIEGVRMGQAVCMGLRLLVHPGWRVQQALSLASLVVGKWLLRSLDGR